MARVTYGVPQPVQPPDGDPVYVKAQIQRAVNAGTLPGSWATIATVTGDPSGKFFYRYEDDGAAATLNDWYRHRFTDVAVGAFSDYSIEVQIDEFTTLLWALADITDVDVAIPDVTQWAEQALIDLWPDIWQFVRVPVIPWDADADGVVDERYRIDSSLFEVWRVESTVRRSANGITAATNAAPIVVTSAAHGFVNGDTVYIADVLGNTAANGSWVVAAKTTDTFALTGSAANAAYTSGGTVRKAGTRHNAWMYDGTEWAQEDREIRFYSPSTGYDYMLHGKGRYRDLTDVGEELFQLLYWQIRKQYLDFRTNQRANTARFRVLDRKSDTTPEQLERFLLIATREVDARMARLMKPDIPIDVAP